MAGPMETRNTKRDWKQIAHGLALDIPESDLENLTPALNAMDAAFAPLAANIPHEVEPAITFGWPAEEGA